MIFTGIPVLVYGKSGSGKSRSLKNFKEDQILLLNIQHKPLPFKGKFKYTVSPVTDEKATQKDRVVKYLGMMGSDRLPVKSAVIDDAGYLMTNQFMYGHSQPKSGSSSFDLFNDIGDSFWSLLNYIATGLPDDFIVYILMHEQTSDMGDTKLRTIGKLLDEKVCIEGMATICLRCMTDGTRHYFLTQSTGLDISKSPEGMFENKEIENDLAAVDAAIRDYYDIKIDTDKKTTKKNEKENEA